MQVIFCAAARTAFTIELNRVDAAGVSNVASSMQDELFRRTKAKGGKYSPFAKKEVADFARVYHQLRWDVEFVGVMVSGQWVSGRGVRICCRAYKKSWVPCVKVERSRQGSGCQFGATTAAMPVFRSAWGRQLPWRGIWGQPWQQ